MSKKERSLVLKLLDLSNELLIKGDYGNALTCTRAAAWIMSVPATADRMQHPSKGMPYDWNKVIEDTFKPSKETDNG